MQVADLIAAGSSQFGWPVNEPDPSRGYYELTFDELKVRVSSTDKNNQSILLLGILTETIPSNEQERNAFFAKVLSSNLAHTYSQQEIVSLTPGGDKLILWRKLKADQTTAPDFFVAMEAFLSSLENWKGIVSSGPVVSGKGVTTEAQTDPALFPGNVPSRFTNIQP